jgi:subtilisin family serine protease
VVGSIDENDAFSAFSNFGTQVQYVAPGEQIYSTYKDNGYQALSGTSMAAPHVSGVFLAAGTLNWNGYAQLTPDGGSYMIIHQ